MINKFKTIGLASLLLFAPSLMAATTEPEYINSHIYYKDFDVTVRHFVENVYEFTVNNYGDGYLSADRFTFNNDCYYSCPRIDSGLQKNQIKFIKPKETFSIMAISEYERQPPLTDRNYTEFKAYAYAPKNDYINVSGPYNTTVSHHESYLGDYNTLDIECDITVLKSYKPQYGQSFMYTFGVQWTYEGKDYTSLSFGSTNLSKTINISFEDNIKIDPSKVTINKIDTFIEMGEFGPTDCGGVVSDEKSMTGTIVGIALMGLGLVAGISALIYFSIKAIRKQNKL